MDTKITVDTTYDNTKNMEMAENDIKEIANPSPQNALTQNVKTACVEVNIVKALTLQQPKVGFDCKHQPQPTTHRN